jgi:glucosamine--fructose-6-phosphate aminotransferase (isomerizing)
MIALYVSRMRDMSFNEGVDYVKALRSAPELVKKTLLLAPRIKEIAKRYAKYTDFLFLGRLSCPSVFFAPKGEIFNKVVSSMQEIKARKGPVIAIATEGCELPPGLADELIPIPDCHEAILPIIATIPVQLLSYYIAVERGCDVDKPRNLAKSVTVE